MSNFYEDSKFGVITRKWFGLTKKYGGETAAGFTGFGTTDATHVSQLARWYPRGPIKMVKFGVFVLGTITNGSVDRVPYHIYTRGASASVGALAYVAKSQNVFGSSTDFTVSQVKAGEYISIAMGTPQTDKGTAANTASTTGTVAFFLDYVPTFDSGGKWDV
jgi:hypothetical protein